MNVNLDVATKRNITCNIKQTKDYTVINLGRLRKEKAVQNRYQNGYIVFEVYQTEPGANCNVITMSFKQLKNYF